MKVVDKQLLFISSDERDSGTISDFTVSMPAHLLTCRPHLLLLVLYKGGDALSVCLNTVAILFLCDIDNIAFDLALGERVRARVEDAGRVELEDAEASALARTKAVHVALLVLGVLVGVWSGDKDVASGLVFLAFLLGGVAEAFVPGASAAQTCKRVGKVLGAALLGFGGFVVLGLVAIPAPAN